MRTTLLILAIFLATVMNGILLYELPVFGKPSINKEVVINTGNIQLKEDLQLKRSDLLTEAKPATEIYRYTRWEYKPWQPARNVIRFLHNRRVLHRCRV